MRPPLPSPIPHPSPSSNAASTGPRRHHNEAKHHDSTLQAPSTTSKSNQNPPLARKPPNNTLHFYSRYTEPLYKPTNKPHGNLYLNLPASPRFSLLSNAQNRPFAMENDEDRQRAAPQRSRDTKQKRRNKRRGRKAANQTLYIRKSLTFRQDNLGSALEDDTVQSETPEANAPVQGSMSAEAYLNAYLGSQLSHLPAPPMPSNATIESAPQRHARPATPQAPNRPTGPVFGISTNDEPLSHEFYVDRDGVTRPVPRRPHAPAFGESTNTPQAQQAALVHPVPKKNNFLHFLRRLTRFKTKRNNDNDRADHEHPETY
ncbi:hypothetical protein CVT26_013019 [Gymnopilus dilepis]|uniref:Uncharacterized protein n=1 Tax=Gymnopilus dilepis TaxID=231916 RepID=A0A409Y4B8_9AGAR|nr:hypothetical protein CVT26_013019 [Gymnopilus dilepis]